MGFLDDVSDWIKNTLDPNQDIASRAANTTITSGSRGGGVRRPGQAPSSGSGSPPGASSPPPPSEPEPLDLSNADVSLIAGYFESIIRGAAPNEAEFNKLVDRTWVRLAAAGYNADQRTQAIQIVLDQYQAHPVVVGAVMAAGGTGVGSIELTDGAYAWTDQQLIGLYGGTGSWIEDDFTDPYQAWTTNASGFFGLTGQEVGDPGPWDGGNGWYGGVTAPTYRAPDRDVIREQVQDYLKNVIGEYEDPRVEFLVDKYMGADRANFDSKDREINPWQVVKETTRTFGDYKALHKNRPEDMDESQWVATTIASTRQQGVREKDQVTRGQVAARVGDLDASQRSFQVQSGDKTLPAFFQQAAKAGRALGNAVR